MENPIQLQSKPPRSKSYFREYFEALLTALLVAFFLRAFVVEAFKIPSKSMVPTLMVGDHIFVNKFVYGLRVPFTKQWIARFSDPVRGEVIVFTYPRDEKLDFIKRVVGVPGDHVEIRDGKITVNGTSIKQYPVHLSGPDASNKRLLNVSSIEGFEALIKPYSQIPFELDWMEFNFFLEQLGDMLHWVQYSKNFTNQAHMEFDVPPGNFFMMGDNRDNSSDSREWGFVPRDFIRGRAMFIWLSIDHDQGGVRWTRFGKWIN